jgi:hypothetical protein
MVTVNNDWYEESLKRWGYIKQDIFSRNIKKPAQTTRILIFSDANNKKR